MKTFTPFSTPLDSDPSLSPMRGIIERYQTDARDINAYFNIPGSEEDLAQQAEFNRQWLLRLDQIDPHHLDLDDSIDATLLHTHLKAAIQRAEREISRIQATDPLLPFRQQLTALLQNRRSVSPVCPRETAARLWDVATLCENLTNHLDPHPADVAYPDRILAQRAVKLLDALSKHLLEWNAFYNGYDPQFSFWITQPLKQLTQNLGAYRNKLAQTYLGAIEEQDQILVGEPLGAEALLQDLAHEWIPYTPEELIQIGQREYQWCEQQMLRASHDLGFGDDWKKALDHTCNQHLDPGAQPALIQSLAAEAIAWIQKRDLVTLPPWCADGWEMKMMTAEKQQVNPYFLGGQTIFVSFPTADMTQPEKQMSLRGNNIHFCRATVHHELIPGHHLQLFMGERYRKHRKLFTTPFLIEGWALHWEFLLWDQSFPQSPENRIGMLFWRMHRCARVIFSLRFHLGQMTAEEAVQFLLDKVGHEPRNARAEIRRSISDAYPPLYQAAYLLGALQMQAMYKELVSSSGSMTPKAFHDAVLRQNAIPLELIRAALKKQPTTPSTHPTWRFYPTSS